MSDSKLNGIPAEGVVMGTPATSETDTAALRVLREGVKAVATGSEFGREGFTPAVASLARAGLFGGMGWLSGTVAVVLESSISCFTRTGLSSRPDDGYIKGLISCGD
jgi:hypothetical protein